MRILFALFILFTLTSVAQRLPFVLYSESDGLPQDFVTSLYQDSKGFLWFGTSAGIARYDGQLFRTFSIEDGLRDQNISCIAEDGRGTLWVGTNFGGVATIDGNLLRSHRVDADSASVANHVSTLLRFDDSTMWIGTENGVYIARNARVPMPHHRSELHTPIISMNKDSRGRIWIGKRDGIVRLEGNRCTSFDVRSGLLNLRIRSIAEDANGIIWIVTEKGAQYFDETKHKFLPAFDQRIALGKIYSAVRDLQGNIWFTTFGNGVIKYCPAQASDQFVIWKQWREKNGLAHNDVFTALQDREGVLWFATRRGVSKLSTEEFENFGVQDGLPSSLISCVTRDRDGSLWVGTSYGFAHYRFGKFRTYSLSKSTENNYVAALLLDRENTLWIGAAGGLYRLVRDSIIREARIDLTNDIARTLYEDANGILWIGTRNGLYALEKNHVTRYGVENGFPNSMLITLTETAGRLWIGTETMGVLVCTKEGATLMIEKHIMQSDGLAHNFIRCVYKATEESLWFGTRLGGLSRIQLHPDGKYSIRNLTSRDGLLGDAVRTIMQDSKQRFWISTGKGVDVYDGARFQHITVRDGLAGDWIFFVEEESDRTFWIGTNNGLTHYLPEQRPAPIDPSIYITSSALFGKQQLPMSLPASLSADQHSLTFRFVSPSFRDESAMQYQYFLEGADSTWSMFTGDNSITYSHLSPDDYVFSVRAKNTDGKISATPARFYFSIAPPFWLQWWFLLSCGVAITSVIFALHRLRVKRLLELERVRLRIATDLHDHVGSTLSSISMFSEIARQSSEGAAPEASLVMQRVGENARSLINALRDIVWSINPEHDTLDQTLLFIKQCALEILEPKGITICMDIPTDPSSTQLPMEQRRHFTMIFKEAMHNIVKHADCTRAEIRIERNNGTLYAAISDNGKGFEPTAFARNGASGNGLRNMQQRANALNAQLKITSQAQRGTMITFTMKIR